MVDAIELQKATSSMNILYVEDDLEVQNNTKMIFEDLFKKVDVACDGIEGLAMYKKHDYDIVITDINMPKMNGIELVEEIKKINIQQAIIIVSAHNETEFFINGIEKGIDGYILKPINYDQLFDILYKVTLIVKNQKENIIYKESMEILVKEKTNALETSYKKINSFLSTDKVTKLPNANLLYQYLDLYEESNLSIGLFRVDNFHFLTQSYSISTCNNILKNIADYLQYNLPKEFTLYKYTDDEFVVTFNNIEKEYLVELMTQIKTFFTEMPVEKNKNKKDIYATLSCALVVNELPLNILQKAKATLNELSKIGTVGHFRVYEENSLFIKELKNDTLWFEKIRDIVENDKLVPYFQPMVSNKTQDIIKYECLVRAIDDGEVISPIYFLEAAKKTGLIENLSKVMINKCFKVFSNTNISFSINLTMEDLLSSNFVDFVIAKQQYYKIKPNLVVFEILENIIFNENNNISIENLTRLKKHGFLLALDDFGSQNSNLSRLVSILDVDIIKIDGQFIRGIDKNKKNYYIVESIVNLAKKLKLEVVAEFVSTKEEFDVVNSLNIGISQGYYFFKPHKKIIG